MDAVTVARARSELPEMMDRVSDGERFVITSDGCNAVLMSEDEYRSLIETLPSYRIRRWPPIWSGPAGHRCLIWRSGSAEGPSGRSCPFSSVS